jgi:hypothetical protein
MIRPFIYNIVALLVITPVHAQKASKGNDPFDPRHYTLNPSDFSFLPRNIARYLKRNGYTIPQCWCNGNPHNVVSGSFAKKGQKDWAVLASKGRKSSVLVFWKGSTRHPSKLQTLPDKLFIRIAAEVHAQYSRMISVVGKSFVDQHAVWYRGARPPPIDHDGINDEYVNKTSTVHYYYKGKWYELQKGE